MSSWARFYLPLCVLVFVLPATSQNQPICGEQCSPDPTSPGYDGTVLSMTDVPNLRGHNSVSAPPAAGSSVNVSSANGVGSSAKSSANVIPGSQSYNYVVPIVSLPGRNGLDLNLALYYNSRIWNFARGPLIGKTATFNSDRDYPSYGFRMGFGFIQKDATNNEYSLIESNGTKRRLTVSGTNYATTDSSFIQCSSL